MPYKYTLELKHPFKVSYGVRTHQKTLVVEFKYRGISGFGESPEIFYYNVNREGWINRLVDVEKSLEGYAMTTPEDLWTKLHCLLSDDSFLLNAIDIAAHDWYGRYRGLPLYKLWDLSFSNIPTTSFTIGLDTIDVMVEKLKEEDWPVYKIKLNAHDAVETVEALRKHTHSTFRVDANCSWSVDQTIEYSKRLKDLGVEFIEQPLAKDDMEGMVRVKKESSLPVIADESCCIESDVDKCKDYFHGINIKLTKCGGITPALRMIKRAKEYGMKVMLGCMIEGTVAISAITQLLPYLDYVDMDGSALIKYESDNATGVKVTPSGVALSEGNGTGVTMNMDNIEM